MRVRVPPPASLMAEPRIGGLTEDAKDESPSALRRIIGEHGELGSSVRDFGSTRTDWDEVEAKLLVLLADLKEKERDVVRLRWFGAAKRYDLLWRQHRLFYYGYRVPIVIGAATVPVLASLSGVSKVATAVVGLLVAILAGLDTFFRFDVRWQQQRHAAAELDSEGWEFLELSGTYARHKTHEHAYKHFLSRLEAINLRLATTYLDLFREAEKGHPEPSPPPGGDVPSP